MERFATRSPSAFRMTAEVPAVGALALYLNFINLFLMLLRLLGGRRD